MNNKVNSESKCDRPQLQEPRSKSGGSAFGGASISSSAGFGLDV
jgi:hypothetical protein